MHTRGGFFELFFLAYINFSHDLMLKYLNLIIMKKMRLNIWNYYLTFPIKKKIKKRAFFERYRRFIKKNKNQMKTDDIYDFFFIKIIKKDYIKWAKFFEKHKIIFK